MGLERVFVEWSSPLLPTVVRMLVDGAAQCDFSELIVVVPGRRAGRRFRELLTEATSGRHDPPQIVTVSELPELLYQPQRPFASELDQRLAWIQAVQSSSREELERVIRRTPETEDADGWFALAEVLWRQHRELAADGLDFADVLQRGDEVEAFAEHDRWHALSAIQQSYLRILDDLGLWDKQTARLVALRQREFQSTSQVALVGMSDLTLVQREMLDQLSGRLTAYVHAPESLSDAFDVYGCVVPEAWTSIPIPIGDEQLVVTDGPSEAGGCVAGVLSRFADRFRADEISVGLADESAAPVIVRRLSECGVDGRWSVGRPLTRTSPARLLSAVADCLESDRTSSFAALARHADIGDWLSLRGLAPDWLPQLDRFVERHTPQRLQDWAAHKDASCWRPAIEALNELLRPLRGKPRPLKDWPQRILDIFPRRLRTDHIRS